MRTTLGVLLAVLVAVPALHAQRPDTLRARTRADSIAKARADSAALADSLALMKALDEAARQPAAAPATGAAGPSNPRLLPDVSAVGDLVADLSPKNPTQQDSTRLGIREVELAFQAVVDPYFRGDVFLGVSDVEGLSIEQAYLTTTSFPWALELRLGRILLPFGKQNTTHRHDLHTVEYPYVIQRLLGPEGARGTGLTASRVFAPFGFYQELVVGLYEPVFAADGLVASERANRSLAGMGYTARLRNYWDITQAANVELSASALTTRRLQPLDAPAGDAVNAIAARQSAVGVDLTYRWRPLQQGLYRSFILQAEAMRQLNARDEGTGGSRPYLGPTRDFTGAYAFARWQLTRRGYVGARYDWLEDPEAGGRTLTAASGYLQWFPSEFSKLLLMGERRMPRGGAAETRLLVQATFAIGPHKPHPF